MCYDFSSFGLKKKKEKQRRRKEEVTFPRSRRERGVGVIVRRRGEKGEARRESEFLGRFVFF